MMSLEELLRHLGEVNGSDLHLKPGAVPHVRVDGQLRATTFPPPAAGAVEALADEILSDDRRDELDVAGEVSAVMSLSGLGRFRVAFHRQRGSLAMVIRRVLPQVPVFADLGLPAQVERFADEEQGLVLITGAPGSGKTTTVAAVVDRINATRACHILTIEDPIEVLHPDKAAIVTQREVGTDTTGYAAAVEGALRQDADVIVVGDIADAATARAALVAAEVGRLVVATMRAGGAIEAVNRLVDLFPVGEQAAARQAVVNVLRGAVTQRLLERADGKGRVPATEVLVGTAKVAEALANPDRTADVAKLMADGQYHGMHTFDQCLRDLTQEGLITSADALALAANPEDLRIALSR